MEIDNNEVRWWNGVEATGIPPDRMCWNIKLAHQLKSFLSGKQSNAISLIFYCVYIIYENVIIEPKLFLLFWLEK